MNLEIQKKSFKTNFHYNKDWNLIKELNTEAIAGFKTNFHYNKDWNPLIVSHWLGSNALFKTNFHYNKDWNFQKAGKVLLKDGL